MIRDVMCALLAGLLLAWLARIPDDFAWAVALVALVMLAFARMGKEARRG